MKRDKPKTRQDYNQGSNKAKSAFRLLEKDRKIPNKWKTVDQLLKEAGSALTKKRQIKNRDGNLIAVCEIAGKRKTFLVEDTVQTLLTKNGFKTPVDKTAASQNM